ncbi:MAG: hypothetical protein ACR2OW_16910 [Methyloligellaceae bacterium]
MAQKETQAGLLSEIEDFCRRSNIAESTFGKKAVNDGKFVNRLRSGKSTTLATADKIRAYIAAIENGEYSRSDDPDGSSSPFQGVDTKSEPDTVNRYKSSRLEEPQKKQDFRFYDNRQSYLMFVNTCSEKWVIADRVGMEIGNISPTPPALRLFDAGMGDGTVLTSVMRQMHARYPTLPFYVVGKEISLEDVRLGLQKMPDRFAEHPSTVLVVTNMYYTEAPWLEPNSSEARKNLNWIDVPLSGNTSREFEEQIGSLQSLLVDGWGARHSEITGNPLYIKPSVMVLYRDDHKFMLDQVIPRPDRKSADFDLVIASQPYRSRMQVGFKVSRVLAPLSRSLAPGGRLIGIHSYGKDPGLDVIQNMWPGEDPFSTNNRHVILQELKKELGGANSGYSFNAYADGRSIFRYEMHTLPDEIGTSNIGTSTLMAAWNDAVYVAQIEDERLESVIGSSDYLEITRDVLQKYGGLWFLDESFVVSRRTN